MENGSSSLVCPLFVNHCNYFIALYSLVTFMLLYLVFSYFSQGVFFFCYHCCFLSVYFFVSLCYCCLCYCFCSRHGHFLMGCFIPLLVICYTFCFLLSHISLRGCVDISCCCSQLGARHPLFVHVDTLGASLAPPFFPSHIRFLSLYHQQYMLVVPLSSHPCPIFQHF